MSERHGTTAELLAVRDGEGSAWAREHLARCEPCAGELYRLEQVRARLKALPSIRPPRDRWSLVAAHARSDRRGRRLHSAIGVAAAAALVGVTFLAVRPRPQPLPDAAALDRAMIQSRAMEATLRSISPERRPLNGGAASVAADLEQELSQVDSALNDPGAWRTEPDHVVDLWRQRTGILSALVDVHTANATYAAF